MKKGWKQPKPNFLRALQNTVKALNQQADALDRRAEEIRKMGRMVTPTPPDKPQDGSGETDGL